MTPTLFGRIQTRIVLLATVGVIATLLISPFLPGTGSASLTDIYKVTFRVLFSVLVVGLGWELVYHAIQQVRWEKDWPSMFSLLTGINEGILLWILLKQDTLPWMDGHPPFDTFLVHFTFVWICVWLFAHGPMRVFALRWRFKGGELL